MVSGRREGVLARMAKEEEGKGREVKNGLGMGLVTVLGKAGNKGMEDGDVEGPRLRGGGVLVGPGLKEGLEVDGVMDAVQVGIWEAQLGELLAHGS